MASEEDADRRTDGNASEPKVSSESAPFDPSRMIGIIKRKALIKDLAAAYRSECVSCARELLELQKKWEKSRSHIKVPEETRKTTTRPTKKLKKTR